MKGGRETAGPGGSANRNRGGECFQWPEGSRNNTTCGRIRTLVYTRCGWRARIVHFRWEIIGDDEKGGPRKETIATATVYAAISIDAAGV